MKCGVRISKSELGDMFFYVIVNLISVIACEFAFASRKSMGITCVKDFVISWKNRKKCFKLGTVKIRTEEE